MERGLKRLRVKYAGEQPVSRPASVDEKKWAIFSAYFHDGLSVKGIGAAAGLSPSQITLMLYAVDAQLDATQRAGSAGKPVVLESPIEDLALSLRARNALHSLGCDRVRDALELDLSAARGIGHKTRGEVRAALRNSGFSHPELIEPLDAEIRSLTRRLERIQGRITAALETVAKEISQLHKRLRKRMAATETPEGGVRVRVPSAWPPTQTASSPQDRETS